MPIFRRVDSEYGSIRHRTAACTHGERVRLLDELKSRMNNDEDQTLFVDAGPVEGERPVPEISYVGKVWRPEQRTQIV